VPEIPGNPRSLERALAAILDNAIKFSTDNIAGHLFGRIGPGLSFAREVIHQHGEKSQWRASHLVARREKAAHLPYT